ncbi:MAG: helix-turn-helix domain-containing protein [Alphaproteobacteria bacterium]
MVKKKTATAKAATAKAATAENSDKWGETARYVRDVRESHLLTQARFAEMLGIAASTLYKYESGKHPIPYPAYLLFVAFDECSEFRQAVIDGEI